MADGISWCSPWRATCLVLLCAVVVASAGRCDREPEEARSMPRTPADGSYFITVSGNPEKYVPETYYTVTLQGSDDRYTSKKFSGFMLVVESSSGGNSSDLPGPNGRTWGAGHEAGHPWSILNKPPSPVGTFQLYGDALTKFSERCPNMVTQTSSIPKSEIQVSWKAPAAGSGCVLFRATVVESRDVWYMDEGLLSRELCEDHQENLDEQPKVIDPCCACNEAKYEVTFEGLWSRHTHPKDFPSNRWLTGFSSVIGASHTARYRFWEYGGMASEGLRNMAERGSTRKLESEMKAQSKHIRTIIKARGISYPNVTGKTFAVFRVDSKHHLISLVSMLDPSPDWIVGVSGLELCLENCSWAQTKELNLYPWDAGTDDGVTYISPDSPSQPQETIRRITSSFPNTEGSPFYDAKGEKMKPLAKLYLTRQRLYEKTVCHPSANDMKKENDPWCAVSEWEPWSSCSVSCGRNGERTRSRRLMNRNGRKKCRNPPHLHERQPCPQPMPVCPEVAMFNPNCIVSQWSEWGHCSVTCGQGRRLRSRIIQNSRLTNMISSRTSDEDDPHDDDDDNEDDDDEDGVGEVDECSRIVKEEHIECEEETCELDLVEAACAQEKLVGPCRGVAQRWYFDKEATKCKEFEYGGCRGNRNNFKTEQECERTCQGYKASLTTTGQSDFKGLVSANQYRQPPYISGIGKSGLLPSPTVAALPPSHFFPVTTNDSPIIDCLVSHWSKWTECNATCGIAWKTKWRNIIVHPKNGGRPCAKRLMKKKECRLPPCDPTSEGRSQELLPEWGEPGRFQDRVNCKLGDWSHWTPCSQTCGPSAVQQRTRALLVAPGPLGTPCGSRLEYRPCNLLPCRLHPNP